MVVDNLIHIIQDINIAYLPVIYKLVTTYPPRTVDNGTLVLKKQIW
jgi:hypothetical protein